MASKIVLDKKFPFVKTHLLTTKYQFTVDSVPNLSGKVVVVTGGDSGLGYITCLTFARRNAHVILLVRSAQKGAKAAADIRNETGNENVEYFLCDLSSLKSIKYFAEIFLSRKLPLDILVCNAGIAFMKFFLTEDGIESQFAVNYVGHFFLVNLLLDTIKLSAPSRIVLVGSDLYSMFGFSQSEGIPLDRGILNSPKHYDSLVAYGRSKLALILLARELFKRLGPDSKVHVNCGSPLVWESDLFRKANGSWISRHILSIYGFIRIRTAAEAVLCQLWLASSIEIDERNISGQYFSGVDELGSLSRHVNDKLSGRLWDFTVALIKDKTGVSFKTINERTQADEGDIQV
mmetsp:Transcript_1108/g.1692  ORF Transcript_1108/g.1692 Transcript_1108/m.1692 type:complete len:347 (-) Transcript_1108:380-1420(-)